jgi:sugar phosphate isomerase/epimerase
MLRAATRWANRTPTHDRVMASRVSCSEYSFPAIPGQRERIGIVHLLGFELVDVALFFSSDDVSLADSTRLARQLGSAIREHGLHCEDLFYAAGSTFDEIAPNPPEPRARAARRRGFSAALEVATHLSIPGITILPGVHWPTDPESAWACCVDELAWRVEQGVASGVEVRVEAHAGSIAPLPELARRLCDEVPGLRLALDLSHFELQSVSAERMLGLAPYAGHLHVRAAQPGAIQVRWHENETDFAALTAALDASGYNGSFCIEYIPMEKWRCDELDVVTESLATRQGLAQLGIR